MNSLVQWPRHKYWDKVWNPMIGCKPCSPACEHCYAAAWAKRFGQSFKPGWGEPNEPHYVLSLGAMVGIDEGEN